MRYLWYGFLGLISLGFLGLVAVFGLFFFVIDYYGKDLPDYRQLKNYEPPIVTRLYAGDGRLLAEYAEQKRVFVPIEFMPDLVKNAFIAAEDQNFYTHSGVDPVAVVRAGVRYVKNKLFGIGKRPEGASTITQQVAKNFFFTNEVDVERKFKEAILAYRMTKALSKNQILELYLNEIYLGGGAYGVAAAGLYYFDKSLEELNIAEVAYLASLPKAPNNYHPVKDHDKAMDRRNWVIKRMVAEGYITQAQADLAVLVPLKMVEKNKDESVKAPYFAEEVRRELAQRYGADSLYKGGLAVKTSVDPHLQDIAQKALRKGLMDYDKRHGWRGPIHNFETLEAWKEQLKSYKVPQGMITEWSLAVVLEVDDKDAVIGFVDKPRGKIGLKEAAWARKSLNDGYALGPEIKSVKSVLEVGDVIAVEPKIDDQKTDKDKIEADPNALESAKSAEGQLYELRQIPKVQGGLIAMDPHTGRVLAMQGGWNYAYGGSEFNRATQAQRQPGSAFKPFVYLAALDKGFTPATLILDAPFVYRDAAGNVWKPKNYTNEFYGPTTLRVGVEKSRNLMTVRLAAFLGMDLIAQYSDHFGITDKMEPYLSNALGATETTLLRMTAAYAMIVNGGKKISPTFVDRIQDRHGKTVFKHDARPCEHCGDLIKWESQTVPDIADTREQIADPRTAYQLVSILEGVVQRGTATKLASMGYPLAGKTGTTNESHDTWFIGFSPDLVVGVFAGFDGPKSMGKKETGGSVSVPIFKYFMEEALAGKPATPFRRPPGIRSVMINAETGVRAKPGDKHVIWESFVAGTEASDEMYVLGTNGISASHGGAITDGFTDTGAQGEDASGVNTLPDTGLTPQQQNVPAPAPVATGTGGLY